MNRKPRMTCRVRMGFALLRAKLIEWDADHREPTDTTHPLYDGMKAQERRSVASALRWIDARADKIEPAAHAAPEPDDDTPTLFGDATHEQPAPASGV